MTPILGLHRNSGKTTLAVKDSREEEYLEPERLIVLLGLKTMEQWGMRPK